MKILKIKINNLASLEGESIIDFSTEPLRSAGIFAITGPTGAGKSTILDALCLALYGRTPRYVQAKTKGVDLIDSSGDSINQGDPRAILRDGTATGSAAVTFIGLDSDRYEASWSVRRARGQLTGKLSASSQQLYNLTKQSEVSGTKTTIQKEIERLIGLSFEQFTRSVLLAQGDFTAFMKADKDEKSALLEKLTGSQIYSEISQSIYEHCKIEEQNLNLLKNSAGGIELLTQEAEEQLELNIKSEKENIVDLEVQKANLDQAINWHGIHKDLMGKVSAASAALSEAEEKSISFTELRQQLELVLKTAHLKSTEELLTASNHQLTEAKEELADLNLKIQALESEKEQTTLRFQQSTQNKLKADEAIKMATPLISQAMQLDATISATQEQLKSAQTQLSNTEKSKNDLEEQKKTKQVRLDQNQQSQSQTSQWIDQRSDRKAIAENNKLILGKLEEAAAIIDASNLNKIKKQKLEEELAEIKSASSILAKQIEDEEAQYEILLDKIKKSQEEFAIADLNSIETAIANAAKQMLELTNARNLFDNLCKSRKEYALTQNSHKEITSAIQELQTELKQRATKLDTLRTALATTRDLIAKTTLRHAENIEKLRAALKIEEPCPVCGSKDHPYAANKHNDLADDLLASLKEQEKQAEDNLKQHEKKIHHFQSELKFKEKQLPQILIKLSEQKAQLESLQTKWLSMEYSQDKTASNEAQMMVYFEKATAEIAIEQESLAQKREKAVNLRTSIENLRQTAEVARNKIQIDKDNLNTYNTKQQINSNFDQSINDNEANNQEKLTTIVSFLNGYFPSKDWFETFKSDRTKFTTAIEKFGQDWSLKQQVLDKLNMEIYQLLTDLDGISKQLLITEKQLNEQLESVGKLQVFLDKNLKERQLIFGGKAISEVRSSLDSQLEATSSATEKLKASLDSTNHKITQTEFQMGELNRKIDQLTKARDMHDQSIAEWLVSYNQSHPTENLNRNRLQQLLAYPESWVKETTDKINALDKHIADQKSRLEERKKDLTLHLEKRVDKREENDLLPLVTELKTLLEDANRKVLEQQLLLNTNLKNKKKLSKILKQIASQQKTFESWAALNQLIGSKEGHKFREIAQQYTLDLLLRYANQHLHLLSKRYVLARIEGTLGIQVIDQDMADEIRSVYSLSGGESFLVSLALALGLASLSSKRLKVESLFIDEGFGSLDPSTLSIAMDALERLQDLGRKVGVISHVQEMTERIPVQISVQKKSSGRSAIEILSFL